MQQQQHPQKTCMQQQQQGVQWHTETLPLLCGICVQCNVLGFSPLGEGDAGEEKPLLIQMDPIKDVTILGQIHRIPEVQCH